MAELPRSAAGEDDAPALALTVTVGLAILLLFGAGLRWCAGWWNGQQDPPYRPDGYAAAAHCADAVRAQLAAPASATFAPEREARVTGGPRFIVETWVDAQNAYGATVRSAVTCQVRYAPADTGWVDEVVLVQ